jgi:hypothetical protein
MRLIIKIYNTIKNRYWKDPVWSTVIGAIIIGIGTSIFVFIRSIFTHVTFIDGLSQIVNFLKAKTLVNNAFLLIIALIFLCYCIVFFINQVTYLRKTKIPKGDSAIDELPKIHTEATLFFSDRLSAAFPGQRGCVWYDDPKVIVDRLSIFFQKPINFDYNTTEGISSHPIWWFRNTSCMYINEYKRLSRTKILLGIQEIEIKRMAVHIDKLYYKSFIYLEANGEKQTGLYNLSQENLQWQIKSFGYAFEEYGLFKKRPITRNEYDDHATVINGKVVSTDGATLRYRYLTDYNLIIAAHNSPFNSDKFQSQSELYFNDILLGSKKADELFEFLGGFNKIERKY